MVNYHLKNFNNIYANLAQSAYLDRPYDFPSLNNPSSSKRIDYSQGDLKKQQFTLGGQQLPHQGIVYLQADPTLQHKKVVSFQHTITGGKNRYEEYVANSYQKGLLTDERAGFNAYFLTDTPLLNQETRESYFVVRGSDAFGLGTLNDWVDNNAYFVFQNGHIPQAKLATQAMRVKIAEVSSKAPHAKIKMTAHSLGSMVIAQGVAELSEAELEQIGSIVLLNGPDVTKSLEKMEISQRHMDLMKQKITYYINPFDVVSMFNRDVPYDQQMGQVKIIVPLNYTTLFDALSAHDFGQFQIDASGDILVASADFHPELLEAGQQVAEITAKYLTLLKEKGYTDNIIWDLLVGFVNRLINPNEEALFLAFNQELNDVIVQTRLKSIAWNKKAIPQYQEKLRTAIGHKRIQLRVELLQTAAQAALFQMEDYYSDTEQLLIKAKETISAKASEIYHLTHRIAHYLNVMEVDSLIKECQLTSLWSDDIEQTTIKESKYFKERLDYFSEQIVKLAQQLVEVDANGAKLFDLTDNHWR